MTDATLDMLPELDQYRKDAWAAFQGAAAPLKTSEAWRRVDFARWRLGELAEPLQRPADGAGPSGSRGSAAGCLRLDAGSGRAFVDLDPAVRSLGVVLSTLEDALRTHPALARPALMRCAGPDYAKLEAANGAGFKGGAFLYVPKGVRVERPFDLSIAHGSGYAFPRLAVVVDEGAEAAIVEDHVGSAAGVSAAFGRLRLARGAKLSYFYNQGLDPRSTHFWSQRVDLAADAQLKHYSILLGGALHKSDLHVELLGSGARSELYGVVLGGKSQVFDVRTWQMHRASKSESDLLFKAALQDRARSVYTGMIRVDKEALDCDAFQRNNNLLLSDSARADTTPVLEILTDRVRCKHGATMGPVSAEELFYLGCRGFEPREAAKTLVLGFFEPILRQVPLERLENELPGRVEARL